MLLLYGLTATGDDAAPSVLETLKMSPAPVCTCVTAFPAQPPACLGPSASLAGEGIRSGEWLPTLLMPSLGDHQVHSISWQEHKGPGISLVSSGHVVAPATCGRLNRGYLEGWSRLSPGPKPAAGVLRHLLSARVWCRQLVSQRRVMFVGWPLAQTSPCGASWATDANSPSQG